MALRYARYIGIDPGLGGGIAALSEDGAVFSVERMPPTPRDVLDLLSSLNGKKMLVPAPRAVLEFVRSSPQMGVVSAFSFGRGYGGLEMALLAAEIPVDIVTPQKWRNAMGCSRQRKGFGARDATEAKNVTKRRAQELFPSVTVTHSIADALLLAEYCRRTYP